MTPMHRYKLAHVTLFSYDGPVSESYNELRLRPRHDESQSCLSFRLTTSPSSRPAAHLDYFNNWVHRFHILPEHRELRVESEAVVLVHPQPLFVSRVITLSDLDQMRESLMDDNFDWLSATGYCPLLPALEGLIQESERRAMARRAASRKRPRSWRMNVSSTNPAQRTCIHRCRIVWRPVRASARTFRICCFQSFGCADCRRGMFPDIWSPARTLSA
jgi:transglutaminase-like putative cysteine protease